MLWCVSFDCSGHEIEEEGMCLKNARHRRIRANISPSCHPVHDHADRSMEQVADQVVGDLHVEQAFHERAWAVATK
jgi:hypothetical protein